MKHRNPLFVAGFPYGLMFVAYFVVQILGQTLDTQEPAPASALFPLFGALAFALIGAGYYIYWLVSTAYALRRETSQKIPFMLLLIVPLANYWWLWRYSVAAEDYTKGKVQAALGFLLLVAAGSIGAGIIQDIYNKRPS